MNSKEKVFNLSELEKLITQQWTRFLDPRKLLNFLLINIKDIENPKIQTLLVSHCEIRTEGISLWITYNIVNSKTNVNVTNEVFLNLDGSIKIIRTI